ncbi:MAG: nucleoside hydrolase [Elusimicrobiota bacterium]
MNFPILLLLAVHVNAAKPDAPVKASPGFWADAPIYVDYEQFKSIEFPGPPSPDSERDRQDLQSVRDWQAKRSPQDCARAARETMPDYNHLMSEVTPFPRPLPPEAKSFFWRVRSDAARATSVLKKRFHHARPYARGDGFTPCIRREVEDSYPSGHAVIARIFAHILSDLDARGKKSYYARADEAGLDRVLAGVHYPSDIQAGKDFADLVYAKLSVNPDFRRDLDSIRPLLGGKDVDATEHLLFDTDSAYFADDGVALAMLLKSPRFTVDAVTLVAGNYAPLQGAVYMTHVAKLLGRSDIPFYIGADKPLRNNPAMVKEMKEKWKLGFAGAFGRPVPQPGKLDPPSGGMFSGIEPKPRDAVDVMVERLQKSDEPLTVFAIGPLTNLAKALQRDPELFRRIDRLVIMGGSVRVPGNVTADAEFNVWFDPEAAKLVLAAPIREKVLIGLDLTNQALIDKAKFDELSSVPGALGRLLKDDLGDHYPNFNKNPKATRYIWDALASAYLIDPSIVTAAEPLYLDVVTDFGPKYGGIRIKEAKEVAAAETPVTVLTRLDFPRFYAILKDTLREAPAAGRPIHR